MAKGLTIEVEGLKQTIDKIRKLQREKGELVSNKLKAAGYDIVADAQAAAPVSDNALRGGIRVSKVSVYEVEIESSASYSAFMEFGTGRRVQVPADLKDYAMQFKGKGTGTFKDFLLAIVRWVHANRIAGTYSIRVSKKTGLQSRRRTGNKVNQYAEDYAAAWPIAMSILKNGLAARPYFFPAVYKNYNKLLDELKRQLNK